MRKLISRAGVGALFTVIALSLAPVTAANAQSIDDAQPREHCAVEVYSTVEQRDSAEPVCFHTEDEVVDHLEGLGVNDHAASGVTASGVAASIVVGTVYKDYNGTGGSLTFWGTSGCTGVTFGFPTLASGWDNSISSARGSNGCWLTLYTTTYYGGSRLNCTPYCASIGSWNDNVKSLVFRPTGTFG